MDKNPQSCGNVTYVDSLPDVISKVIDMTYADIVKLVLRGEFIIATDLEWGAITMPQIARGWALRATKLTVHRKTRSVYIIATASSTGRLWKRGMFNKGVNAGLSKSQAYAYVKSSQPLKHTLLSSLVSIVTNPDTIAAYVALSGCSTIEDYALWARQFNITDKLGTAKRIALRDLLFEVLDYPV